MEPTVQILDAPTTTVWGHIIAILTWLGAVAGLLPVFAAFIAAVWYMIQIYESETCQHWLERRRMLRKARLIAKLRAKQKVVLAELEALELVREARSVAQEKVKRASHEAAVDATHHDTHEQAAKLAEAPGRGAFVSHPAADEDDDLKSSPPT